MTLNIIYNRFIDGVLKKEEFLQVINDYLLELQKYSYTVNDNQLTDRINYILKIYNSSIIYYDGKDVTTNLIDSIIIINEMNKQVVDKIELITMALSFFFRKENSISIYERDGDIDYMPSSYVKYGLFLYNVEKEHYDWIAPIIGSKKVEKVIENLTLYDAETYLKYIYFHFYKLFFPYNNQNLELYDIFSEIDMINNNKMLSKGSFKFLTRNIRDVQAKSIVKKKTIY